jgi:uncharacterized protein YndB with AHSA1/START domain
MDSTSSPIGVQAGPGERRAHRIAVAVGPISVTTPIDVPRQRAFDFLADLANRPSFMGSMLDEYRLERLDSTGVGAGARFRVADRDVWMESVITELEPPHRIVERGSAGKLGRIPVGWAWELTEGPGGGSCEVMLAHWSEPAHPADRVAERRPGVARFYRRQLRAALAQLRDVLESDRGVERVVVAGGDLIPGAG